MFQGSKNCKIGTKLIIRDTAQRLRENIEKLAVYWRQKQGRNKYPESKSMGIVYNEEECSMAQALQRHTPERSAGILREEELSMKVMQITYVGQSFGSLFTFGQLSCFFLHTCLVHGTSPRCMCCKVSVEKKRMSQEFRQRKVYYKKERKQLDLERKWCSLFTANPSYTLLMGNCSQREGATIDL